MSEDLLVVGLLVTFGVPALALSCGVWTLLKFGEAVSASASLITE